MMMGSQVLCARYMGAGDLQKTRGVFSLNITLTVAATIFASLISFTLSSSIANILGATPETVGDLSGYITGRGVGLIPMVLGSQLAAFLSLEGQDKYNYIATAILLVFNIALDLLFAAVWKLWKELWGLVKIGFPSPLVFFLTSIRSSVFNNLVAAYDPTMTAVAALSTYVMVLMIFESVGKGVAASGRLLTNISYGEEDGRSITAIMKTVFTKGLLIALAASVVTFLLSNFATGLFYSDKTSEVYRLTVRMLRFGAAVLILETIAYVFNNYFQAIGRNVIVNVMSVLEGIAVMVRLDCCSSRAWGLTAL